jgi:hypothetical protein
VPREVIFMGRPYKCPYCGQSESVGKGIRKTKTMGERRIRQCKACGRKFTPKNQKGIEDLPTQGNSLHDASAPAVEGPAEPSAVPVTEPAVVPAATDTHVAADASADGKPS